MKLILRQVRSYQWTKNVLIFVPCIAGHTIFSSNNLVLLILTFVCFSIVASSGYILNDIVDLEQDRLHPEKRIRPIAAGLINVKSALILQITLLIVGVGGSIFVHEKLPRLLLIYFMGSAFYSTFLKKIFLVDVAVLSLFYIFRVYVGAVVGDVLLSKWLITFSGLIFFCLAIMKRFGEVHRLKAQELRSSEKLYKKSHGIFLKTLGLTAAALSLVVFVRYLYSHEVLLLYRQPALLWLTCLAIEFWLLRMWYFTLKGWMTSDPIVFALRDPASYAFATVMLISIWLAI